MLSKLHWNSPHLAKHTFTKREIKWLLSSVKCWKGNPSQLFASNQDSLHWELIIQAFCHSPLVSSKWFSKHLTYWSAQCMLMHAKRIGSMETHQSHHAYYSFGKMVPAPCSLLMLNLQCTKNCAVDVILRSIKVYLEMSLNPDPKERIFNSAASSFFHLLVAPGENELQI